ncbi:thioredoxin [Halorubrum distributum JCM 13561]|uniref:Thioredoxin n=3 Tax=Halorubrum distributum TaxID=29283 RepID=M0NNT7_9EURY|nr:MULTISPECIES: thioredoxin family protein [Halorubrum distributum group]PHQ47383.1 thiol reductase thioredoxin [Halorubrum sp. C3]EMA59436.1 thioredoxin [Halorubrum litoreum JCM 13561]EMA69370.1 thioredoxin [Halorubrum arcis JCM 13916]MDV7350829.1 thioredoxin family protein [Halorubrum distributum]MYL15764.1 thioredoxin [Halorubrum terrestre]
MSSNTVSSEAETADGGSSGGRRPVSLSDEDALDDFVADADAALVEFYTDGCGICASMEPVIGNVARGAETDLAVGMVNPRDDPPLVERFDVRSVPLFVLFVDGEPVARRAEGFIPGDDLTAWVDEHAN